ncbi:hypothetical protein [Sporosarcina aquimarina]|uniref:Uncharacterized protein n=1 Tax=Sporosarcina aquimarina TaxID=114975 RepID=A0ABU4FXN2_9BACL|nr:hypothetical protein [Sporosarcina aquimarina]MDW0109406.1 hypothetical protein [Sporosarcina aquimarina]
MELFILGVLFVFAKVNLHFFDTGVFFYSTNIVGYLLIYLGLKKIGYFSKNNKKMQLIILLMMIHSVVFTLLNGSGHSIQTIEMSTAFGSLTALTVLVLAAIGNVMIFYILHQFILSVRNNQSDDIFHSNIASLEIFAALLFAFGIVTGALFFIIASVASISMILLLAAEIVFIVKFSTKAQTV